MEKTKTCKECGKELSATTEYFYKHRKAIDGLIGKCKQCIKAYEKYKYKCNKEKIISKNKAWSEANKCKCAKNKKAWALANKDKMEKYYRDYYIKNKEKINKNQNIWYKANKQRANEKSISWAKKNPEKINRIIQKRRAAKKQLSSNLTDNQWNNCKKYFNNQCAYCGKIKRLTQDHFIPLSKGGEYTKNNIIPACKNCNSSKQDKDFFDWYPKQTFYSKKLEQKILKYLNCSNNIKTHQLALNK